jgi:hypothetical protein
MFCPSNPTPINRKSTKSRAAILLEEGMRGKAVSTCLVSPATFPAESAAGKRWQILSHSAIQPGSYLHPGSATSPTVFRGTTKFRNILKLKPFLGSFQTGITQIFQSIKFGLYRCNLFSICVIKDFSIPEKSCIFFLTSKSTSGIIRNYVFKYLSMQY